MDNKRLTEELYNILGGKDNIEDATNCMTRLRVRLVREDDEILRRLKTVSGVMGINRSDTELQIILGPGTATQVTDNIKKLLSEEASGAGQIGDGKALHDKIRARNATPVKLFMKKIAGVFIPLIPGFIACGLITGCMGVALKLWPHIAEESWAQLLIVAGNTVFWGINLFVGYNAAKVFGGSPILGGILAALMCHPGLSNISLHGENLLPGRGGVISVVMVAMMGAWVERRLHKIIPAMFDLFLTPLLTFLVTGSLAILLLQPIGGVISDTIGSAATGAVASGGAAVGFVLAGMWLPVVMLGIHQAMTPIHADLIVNYGVTILLPILAMAGAGQVGASLAVYVKTKNKFLKKTVASALPVGVMGVGEPLIYGVTLPLGKPFIAACIGGACGGAVEASFMVGASTLGISGLPLAGATNNIPIYLLGLVTAYVIGFLATWLIGFDDPEESEQT